MTNPDRSAYKTTIVVWTRDSEIDGEGRAAIQREIDEANGECTVFKTEFVEDALADPDGRESLGPVFGWDRTYPEWD